MSKKKSCVYIPDELFRQFLDTTNNNRKLTKTLWVLAKNKDIQSKLKLKDGFSATDFLDALGTTNDISNILDRESIVKYVTKSENVHDMQFESMRDALDEAQRIHDKYETVSPLIYSSGGMFKIRILDRSQENEKEMFRQVQLQNLNTNLIDYIEKLGFSVKQVDGLETPGVFSPVDAETNADGLKQAIRVSKDIEGQKAIPEEVSHLLVEGFQDNIFMKRLMYQMTPDIVIDILGDEYDQYSKEYDYDETMLKKEAVGKLVAQHLVDRNGIGNSIMFISQKMLDRMKSMLNKGNESDIDGFLKQMNDNVKRFVDTTFASYEISAFDNKLIDTFEGRLKRIRQNNDSLRDAVEQSYNIMAKRVKLKQLNDITGKQSASDISQFTAMDRLVKDNDDINAAIHFLDYSTADCQGVLDDLLILRGDYRNGLVTGLPQMKRMFRVINDAEAVVKAYSQNTEDLQSLNMSGYMRSDIDVSYIEQIQMSASELSGILKDINRVRKEMLVDGLYDVYSNYWCGDKEYIVNGKKTFVSLEDVLEQNIGDMSMFSRLMNSMSDAQDPLLQMADMLMKDSVNKRDKYVFALQQQLSEYMSDYVRETGSRDMRFAFETDDDGKITGMLKSDRDYAMFYKRKNEYKQSLVDAGITGSNLASRLKSWEFDNTELVNVAPEGSKKKRMERMPKLSLYQTDAHRGMNESQAKLYDNLIEIKKSLDSLLPKSRTRLYKAPMKKIQINDQLVQTRSLKGIVKRIKDKYITDVTGDTEFGEDVQIDQYVNGKHIILDFSGKEVKKVPVYYTTMLDDMSLLDTNLVDTMLSYGAMAFNYHIMSETADFMEATNSLVQDRQTVKTSGLSKLRERFRPTKDIAIQNDYKIKGSDTEGAKKLRNYIDANVYGMRKDKETVTVNGMEINIGKIGDNMKNYSSIVGLGYNLFSGTTNLTMGIAQAMFEAAAASFAGDGLFKLKDIIKANGMYFKDLPQVIMEQYTDRKKNKTSLLIQKFDCMEEYYQTLDDSNYYGGVFKKIVGKHNPLIFNSMGEHYLHTLSMLAALNNVKVKIAKTDSSGNIIHDSEGNIVYGDTISLYDAYYVKENEMKGVDKAIKYSTIELPDNIVKENGEAFTEDDFNNLKLRIQQVNHRMHGAFNDIDRGDIHRMVVGRMAMQFRQWMPAFYMSRFRKNRINVLTGENEEGFYNTYYKFIAGTIKDAIKLKFNIGERYGMLTDSQKANIWKGLMESSTALSLGIILRGNFGNPEKDDPAIVNMIKYNMYRLKMELVAASPMSIGFIQNAETLIKSPVPAMENIDRLISLLDFTMMNETIQTGKYAGWNKYVRNLYFAAPGARNVGRFVDMVTDGDISMFNPYIKTK